MSHAATLCTVVDYARCSMRCLWRQGDDRGRPVPGLRPFVRAAGWIRRACSARILLELPVVLSGGGWGMPLVRDEARARTDRAADLERSRRGRAGRDRRNDVDPPEQGASGRRTCAIQARGTVGVGGREHRHGRDANRGRERGQHVAGYYRGGRASRARQRRASKCSEHGGWGYRAADRAFDRCKAWRRAAGEISDACVACVVAPIAVGALVLATLGRDPRRCEQPLAHRCVDRTQFARRAGRIARLLATHSRKGTRRLGRAAQFLRDGRVALRAERYIARVVLISATTESTVFRYAAINSRCSVIVHGSSTWG